MCAVIAFIPHLIKFFFKKNNHSSESSASLTVDIFLSCSIRKLIQLQFLNILLVSVHTSSVKFN